MSTPGRFGIIGAMAKINGCARVVGDDVRRLDGDRVGCVELHPIGEEAPVLRPDTTRDALISSAATNQTLTPREKQLVVDHQMYAPPDPIDGHVPAVTYEQDGVFVIRDAISPTDFDQHADEVVERIKAFATHTQGGEQTPVFMHVRLGDEERARETVRRAASTPTTSTSRSRRSNSRN